MRAAATVAVLSCAAVLVASFSCATFDYPRGSCTGSGVVPPGGAAAACAACAETNCCDAVGFCEDQGPTCTGPLRDMAACVASKRASASAEAECAPTLKADPRARTAYTCMRDRCGQPCDLPWCRVDTGARLIANAECDNCFSGSCCPELNACYQNRTCKLIVDCISDNCTGELGPGLTMAFAAGFGELDASADPACTMNAPPNLEGVPARCIAQCMATFGPSDQAGAVDPASGASCLALRLFVCGIHSQCGAKCAIADGGVDGGG